MTTSTRRARALLAAGVVAAAVLGGLPALAASAPPPGAAACTPDPVLCPERLYVGVSSPGLPGDTAGLQQWAGAVGHRPNVAMSFQQLGTPTDVAGLTALSRAGRLPMVTLEPYDATAPTADPYPLAAIAAGQFDTVLRQHAQDLAAVGAPVAVRFAHEMNGAWYPWGQGVNGNTPATFLAAWRHVHDLFTAAGASRVVWTWAPNLIDGAPTQDLAALYPGDAYVDWVGLSGYFDEVTDTYQALYRPTLTQLDRVAPGKPIYIAETAVLPGPTRPAMIHDLVTGLLGTRRLVGFTWLERVTRLDWRLSDDPAAAAAMARELAGGWFASADTATPPTAPSAVAPYPQDLAAPTGQAQVGVTLTATYGTWRAPADSGTVSYAGRWYRCSDPTGTTSCTATAGTSQYFAPSRWDLLRYLRYQVTATNAVGSTVGWSDPTRAILLRPATPAAPDVEARDGALRIVFPSTAPLGTTHWRVTVAGAAQPLVRLGSRPDTWVSGLTNAMAYALSLSAVSASATDELASSPTSGSAVPMTAPYDPYLRLDGTTGTLRLPPVPAGATGWTLSIDGAATTVATATTSVPLAGLTPGPHTWALRGTAGSWQDRAYGSRTVAAQGSVAGLATPGPPAVATGARSATFTLPPLPAGGTGWQLTVGASSYPVAGSALEVTAGGLTAGRTTGWTLRATQATSSSLSRSDAVTGTLIPGA